MGEVEGRVGRTEDKVEDRNEILLGSHVVYARAFLTCIQDQPPLFNVLGFFRISNVPSTWDERFST